MKKEIAELWTAALRSGDYQQSTSSLVKVDTNNGDVLGYCCLGVLCDLAEKADVDVVRTKQVAYYEDDEEWHYNHTFDGRDDLLPDVVRKWAGMDTNDGSIYVSWDSPEDPAREDFNNESLAGLNDEGKTFAQIADLIEKYSERL